MSSLHQIETPSWFRHIETSYFLQVNESNLGRAILIATFIEICINQEFNLSRRCIKTKLRRMKIEEDDSFLKLFSVTDARLFISYCQDQYFYDFLGRIGGSLITEADIYKNICEVQQVSKDFNIKLLIYEDSSLVSQGISYEFEKPACVYLICSKSKQNFYVKYLFKPVSPEINKVLVKNPGDTQKKLNGFGDSVSSLTKLFPVTKELKQWLYAVVKENPMIKRTQFIQQILLAKEKVTSFPDIRTFKTSVDDLKISQFIEKSPNIYKKFLPLPESEVRTDLNYNEEITSDDDPGQEESKYFQSSSRKTEVSGHCKTCVENPSDIGNFECGCSLSFDCIEVSYLQGQCVYCKKAISEADKLFFSNYFS